MPSRASSSVDLMVAVSCGLTLQICLIIAVSFRCRRWRLGFVNGQVSLAWSIALRTHKLYTWPCVLKERWREERPGMSSLNFFQAVFTCVVVESSKPPAAECSPDEWQHGRMVQNSSRSRARMSSVAHPLQQFFSKGSCLMLCRSMWESLHG